MVFAINKKYSKSAIKATKDCSKICPKLTKISKRHDRHCCGISVAKFGQVLHTMKCF